MESVRATKAAAKVTEATCNRCTAPPIPRSQTGLFGKQVCVANAQNKVLAKIPEEGGVEHNIGQAHHILKCSKQRVH
ncbi:hypothetical protein ACOMHN_031237 [Nucella lapillus]